MDYIKKARFHLPGAFERVEVYSALLQIRQQHPDWFRNVEIASVYGSPGGIWNGGRAIVDQMLKEHVEQIRDFYASNNIPVRFTFTNCLLQERHIWDTYCNLVTRIFNSGNNEILCNREVLEKYLRKNYKYNFVLSTTNRIKDPSEFKKYIKDYSILVADYSWNNNFDLLKTLPCKDKIEFLCNEACSPDCPRRLEHYKELSRLQLNFTWVSDFHCENETRSLVKAKTRPHFISPDLINKYLEMGFNNFKLEGRTQTFPDLAATLAYYIIKDEYQEEVRSIITNSIMLK